MSQALRQQLTDAMEVCRRQIEILRSPVSPRYVMGGMGQPPDNHREIALMEEEYRRLAEALANLGPSDA
jgi:hypothetical protein